MLNSSLIISRWNIFFQDTTFIYKMQLSECYWPLFVPFPYVIPYGIDRNGFSKFVHMDFYLRKIITFALSWRGSFSSFLTVGTFLWTHFVEEKNTIYYLVSYISLFQRACATWRQLTWSRNRRSGISGDGSPCAQFILRQMHWTKLYQ